jgi:hypothetical protein
MKRELKNYKRLSELYSLFGKRRLQTSQAIDQGLRRPRTQHHLQQTSHQLSLLSSITSVSTLMVGTQQVLGII